MKNKDVLKLWSGLNDLNNKANTKLSYVIMRNRGKIKDIIEALKNIEIKKLDGAAEFDKDRLELCSELAVRDADGNPVKVNIGNGIKTFRIANQNEFDKRIIPICKKHSVYLDNLEKKQGEFNTLLEEDAGEIDFMKIKIDDLPTDLTATQLEKIEVLLSEQ